jgi:MSHA pilin protein MshD
MINRRRSGFTLAEATVASVIVAIVIVTAMNAAGSVRKTEMSAANRAFGVRLAETLMEEILLTDYIDPQTKVDAIGLDAGETQSNRRTLDDVDDYHGLRDEPPVDVEGNPIAGAADWVRTVEVVWTKPDDPTTESPSSLGRKRIKVTVQRGKATVAELVAVRAQNVPARKEY